MSLKLFINLINIENNSCDFDNCEICSKNKCYLLKHEKGERGRNCICQECICGKECVLNNNNNKKFINCDIKCCLKKNMRFIKYSYEGCNCKCLCNCICKQNEKVHKNSYLECKNENKKCESKECKCKYPILLHNFICMCLDFEGLGIFESTKDQDIQKSLCWLCNRK